MELFRQILECQVKFPNYVTDPDAILLLTGLLEKIPELRLGTATSQLKEREVKQHGYFKGFDWDAVAGGYHEPPWRPNEAAIRSGWEPCTDPFAADDQSKDSDFGSVSSEGGGNGGG